MLVGVAFHVFVGGLVFGDLEGLDDEEEGYPGELEGGPEGEGDGPGVAEDEGAEGWGEDVAGLGGGGGGEEFHVAPD